MKGTADAKWKQMAEKMGCTLIEIGSLIKRSANEFMNSWSVMLVTQRLICLLYFRTEGD